MIQVDLSLEILSENIGKNGTKHMSRVMEISSCHLKSHEENDGW